MGNSLGISGRTLADSFEEEVGVNFARLCSGGMHHARIVPVVVFCAVLAGVGVRAGKRFTSRFTDSDSPRNRDPVGDQSAGARQARFWCRFRPSGVRLIASCREGGFCRRAFDLFGLQ
jgi:hypothetical protein